MMTSEALEICLTEKGEHYVRNEAAIKKIVGNVRNGHYCTILGARYCQKSLLLKDLKNRLEAAPDHICVLLDLQPYSDRADNDVLREVAIEIDRRMREQIGGNSLPSPYEVVDEHSLQRFFSGYVRRLKRDPVFLIDHLEEVRPGPLNSLLRAVRAVYNERKPDEDSCRLIVVIASSLMVSDLLLGPTSPFNIAQLTLVKDLTREESTQLILAVLKHNNAEITAEGLERLLAAASGDRYLLQQLCARALHDLAGGDRRSVGEPEIVEAIDWIIREKAHHSKPLRETVYSLEDDSQCLLNVLKILSRGRVPRRELKLGLSMAWDKIRLTGAVSVETIGKEKVYRIRNEIYDRYLKNHFTHERVAHVLSMAGQWESAIEYLEQVVKSNSKYRSTLLGTVLDSIYAARSAPEAYQSLAPRLGRAFSLPKVRIYILNTERTRLRSISQVGFDSETSEDFSLEETERPEVSAYFRRHYEVSNSPAGEPVTLIPILRDEWQTLGVAAVYDFARAPDHPDFQELLAFLKQVGRALGSAIQLSALYETGKQVTGSLDLQQTMQTTLDEAIRAVPGAQRGSVLLWDAAKQHLVIRVQRGYRSTFAEEVQMPKGVGYVGAVYLTGEPLRMGNVMDDPRTFLKADPDITKAKSAICVPLQSWGRVTGVLCLDNITAYDAFQESDLRLLSAFADQAAIAIQNAQLSTELNELGMSINRGDFDLRQIFEKVVQSITHVSGAKAATLISWPDEDVANQEALPKSVVSVSDGLGPDYDHEIRPRTDGLTLAVMREQKPIAVSHPDDGIGINPLAQKHGIKAQIGLPMIYEKIIGVLFVLHDKPHDFSESEIKMLSLFANQAAMAIKNKGLRDQIQDALRLTSRMVAHRLRNVLPIISDRIARSLDRGMVTGDGIGWNRVALKEARRAQKIVSDFETFSHSEAFSCSDVLRGEEVVTKLHDVVRESFSADDLEIEIHVEPELPTVKVNFDKLSDDFVNFARDSERHKKQGLRVAIRGELSDGNGAYPLESGGDAVHLRLVYADNGPGIEDDRKEKIYEPFHTTTGGSGLGLAIAKHNASVHGGSLIECGQPGSGVRFELYLPAVPNSPGEERKK